MYTQIQDKKYDHDYHDDDVDLNLACRYSLMNVFWWNYIAFPHDFM